MQQTGSVTTRLQNKHSKSFSNSLCELSWYIKKLGSRFVSDCKYLTDIASMFEHLHSL